MKNLFAFLLFFCSFVSISAQTFEIPEKPTKFKQTSVYDYIGLLSSSQKSYLEQKLIKYSDSTSTQIVVSIIPSTKGEYIGTLAPRWAHKWGVGQAKEDNGVFILLAKNDRKIWIAPGYGVEHKLTAGITGDITRTIIIPEFKKGDYSSGLNKGVDAIIDVLKGTYKARPKNNNSFPFLPLFIIIVVIVLLVVFSKNKNNRGGRGGGFTADDIFSTIILSGMGRSGGSGFGSSGGSFGGGGFGGGFGGGGFSGGGAGGSW